MVGETFNSLRKPLVLHSLLSSHRLELKHGIKPISATQIRVSSQQGRSYLDLNNFKEECCLSSQTTHLPLSTVRWERNKLYLVWATITLGVCYSSCACMLTQKKGIITCTWKVEMMVRTQHATGARIVSGTCNNIKAGSATKSCFPTSQSWALTGDPFTGLGHAFSFLCVCVCMCVGSWEVCSNNRGRRSNRINRWNFGVFVCQWLVWF